MYLEIYIKASPMSEKTNQKKVKPHKAVYKNIYKFALCSILLMIIRYFFLIREKMMVLVQMQNEYC